MLYDARNSLHAGRLQMVPKTPKRFPGGSVSTRKVVIGSSATIGNPRSEATETRVGNCGNWKLRMLGFGTGLGLRVFRGSRFGPIRMRGIVLGSALGLSRFQDLGQYECSGLVLGRFVFSVLGFGEIRMLGITAGLDFIFFHGFRIRGNMNARD